LPECLVTGVLAAASLAALEDLPIDGHGLEKEVAARAAHAEASVPRPRDLWVVAGDLFIAPNGRAKNLGVNLLSNLGPVLLLVAVGALGLRMWSVPPRAKPPG
jgi:hypothetical protein